METEKKGNESQRNQKREGGGGGGGVVWGCGGRLAHWCDLKRPLLALI